MRGSLLADIVMDGIMLGGLYALVAVGLNMQYGISKILNLAHGEFIMVGAFATYWLHVSHGVNPYAAMLIVGPTAFLLGMLIYRFLFRKQVSVSQSAESMEIGSILIAFGLMFLVQNLALLTWGSDVVSYSILAGPVKLFVGTYALNRIVAFGVVVVLTATLYLFLSRTWPGAAIRAISAERVGAQIVGIPVDRLHAVAFALGIAAAAVGGSLVSTMLPIDANMGVAFTMKALIIIVLGGAGNLLGSLLGGIILGVTESLGAYFIDPGLTMALNYMVLLAIILISPKGILKGVH